jgi:hypothetical protein
VFLRISAVRFRWCLKRAVPRDFGLAAIGTALLLLSSGVHGGTRPSLQVGCAITAIDLDFPEINPMVVGLQHGNGTVVIACTNHSQAERVVNLSVLDTVATTHALKTRATDAGAVLLDLYVDPERRFLLSALASSPHVLRQQLHLGPGARGVTKLRFYPAVRLKGAVAAGDYGKQATMQLQYQAHSAVESAPMRD